MSITGQGLDANGIWIDTTDHPRFTLSRAFFLETDGRMTGTREERRLATRLETAIAIELALGSTTVTRDMIDIDYHPVTGAPTLLTIFYPGA